MSLATIIPGWRRNVADAHGAGPWASVARTHVGRVRQFNEDRFLDDGEHGLWAVADGMGGHCAGDVAAEAVIEALRGLAASDVRLDETTISRCLEQASESIHEDAQAAGRISGSTVVALSISGSTGTLFWAGDSRAYRWRRGMIERLTRDHSVVQELIDAGAISAEAGDRHPQSHVLTRALGAHAAITVDRATIDLEAGDLVLLCSDGLVRGSSDPDLVYLANHPVDRIADELLGDALAAGGKDNITLVIIEILPPISGRAAAAE